MQLHCFKTHNSNNHRHCRDGKSVQQPVQHLPQQEIQETSLSVQAHSLTNNEILKVATVVQQIMRELSEAVSQEEKIMVITKKVLNLM
jgi:hypothetical protein